MYGIIVWESAYTNVLEPLNKTHRILIRIIMKNEYVNDKENTNDLFLSLKILTVEQLYNKLSIIKIYLNIKEYELQKLHKTKGENGGNWFTFIKPNTTLIGNYYVNSGIQLFNQLPSEIKLIDNKIKFLLTKIMYISDYLIDVSFKLLTFMCFIIIVLYEYILNLDNDKKKKCA